LLEDRFLFRCGIQPYFLGGYGIASRAFGGLQSGDLSFEVVSLLVGADPAVADDSGLSPGAHPDINVE
jgi:hypothetical protein